MNNLEQFLGQSDLQSLDYKAKVHGFNFEFRTSQPNGVSEGFMKETENIFSSLTYPYTFKGVSDTLGKGSDIVITDFWTCYKPTKYLYQRVRFVIHWDGDRGKWEYVHAAMKREFPCLKKSYVIYGDPIDNPSPFTCLSGYSLGTGGGNGGNGENGENGGVGNGGDIAKTGITPGVAIAVGVSALALMYIIYMLVKKK